MEDRAADTLPFAVTQIRIYSFRRFPRLYFRPSRINILVGVNGAGKSSVLSAIGILLSRLTSRIVSGKSGGLRIHSWDIENGAAGAVLHGAVRAESAEYQYLTKRTRSGRMFTPAIDDEALHWQPSDGSKQPVPGVPELADIYRRRLTADASASIPLVAMYSVNRAVLDIPLRIRKRHQFDQVGAYEDSFASAISFRTFFEWFREREDLENETRLDNPDYRDRNLMAVRKAITDFMPEYKDLRVRRGPLRMTVVKGDDEIQVNQMSDGEKALLSLIGDLARRLAIANPAAQNPLSGAGVVLVDEIELHLHPNWQRRVVEGLPKVFPNLQFFLTTHSAIVANSAPDGSLFALRGGQLQPVDAFGQDVVVVLHDIFGTSSRPPAIQAKVDRLFMLIEEDLSKAAPLLAELKEELPTHDEVLVRADARIARRLR